jgi:hypothetical protein
MKKIEHQIKELFQKEVIIKDSFHVLTQKLEIKKRKKTSFFKYIFTTRKGLIWSLSSFMILGIVTSLSFVFINGYLNTPTYQGMEVASNTLLSQNFLLSDVSDEFIDDIETEIGIETLDGISYYTQVSERIIITVKLDNPLFFEILSFTLNGRLYQTFEFIEGSNSEQLLIYFNVRDLPGIQEITVDAIKYVDGSNIRDVRFEADRTIQIGILYEVVPTVTNVSELVQATAFGVSFVVNDVNLLLNPTNGTMIYVFDGTNIVFANTVSIGTNVMPYSNLRMGSTYEYAIVGVYDPLDGLGKRAFILHQNTFTTSKGFAFDNISSETDSISFDINAFDLNNGSIDLIEVALNDEVIQSSTLDLESYVFDSLLSNTNYDVTVTYSYSITVDGTSVKVTDTIQTQVKTATKPTPTINFSVLEVSQKDISFAYQVSDIESVTFEKIDLLLEGELVFTISDLSTLSLDMLLSNSNYSVLLYYTYNLNDGNGDIPQTFESSFKTLSNTKPEVVFTSAIAFASTLFAKFRLTDPSAVGEIVSFDLYKDGTLVQSISENIVLRLLANETYIFEGDLSFEYLGSGDYLLVANYTYDLNDGNGVITIDTTDVNDINTLRYIN